MSRTRSLSLSPPTFHQKFAHMLNAHKYLSRKKDTDARQTRHITLAKKGANKWCRLQMSVHATRACRHLMRKRRERADQFNAPHFIVWFIFQWTFQWCALCATTNATHERICWPSAVMVLVLVSAHTVCPFHCRRANYHSTHGRERGSHVCCVWIERTMKHKST